jgi:hypothetical protein
VNAEVHWFCSLNEGVLTPELCRELFTLVGESAEMLVFGQQVMDLQLTDDLDKFHTMMSELYTGAKSGEPPTALELGLESSTTAIPAVAAPDAADSVLVTSGPVDAEPGLALVNANAEFNWNHLPSLTGVEEMSDKEVLKVMASLLGAVREIDATSLRICPGAKPCVIRDMACIKLVLTCASMGTLVLCSAHTNNAAEALDRMISVFPVEERSQIQLMLAKTTVAVITQILCAGADGQSKIPAHEVIMRCDMLSDVIRQGEVLNLRAYINDEVEGMQSLDGSLRKLRAEKRLRRRKRICMPPTRASLLSACRNTHIGPQKSGRSRSAWKL